MPRMIGLKEFAQSTEIVNTPPHWYVAARDPSLVQQPYKIKTDGWVRTTQPDEPHSATTSLYLISSGTSQTEPTSSMICSISMRSAVRRWLEA